jgi:hypothetical protein
MPERVDCDVWSMITTGRAAQSASGFPKGLAQKMAAVWLADPDRARNMMNFLQIVIPF